MRTKMISNHSMQIVEFSWNLSFCDICLSVRLSHTICWLITGTWYYICILWWGYPDTGKQWRFWG